MKSLAQPAAPHRSHLAMVMGALALLTVSAFAAPPAAAQQGHLSISPAELSSSRDVQLGLGKSLVIDLPRDAKDVLVADPKVADAVMRTARRAYLIGNQVGQTNVFFFDGAGRQIAVLEVNVSRDTHAISASIADLIPGSSVNVEAAADNIVLSGSVANPDDAKKAADIAARFVGDPEKVLNMITAAGSEQVHLKVTIAEVKRSVIKQLGVSLDVHADNGNLVTSVLSQPSFGLGTSASSALDAGIGWSDGVTSIDAEIRALEQQSLLRVLAEPTLSAISGEKADFLAGGQFPIITGVDSTTGTPTIEFKEFGVSLAFTPVVLSGGRISLRVSTEVSELDNETAVSLSGIAVPGVKVRRAQTTVELPSGGSLVLAGLLQNETNQSINGVPGIKDLPILGDPVPEPRLREQRDRARGARHPLPGEAGGAEGADAPRQEPGARVGPRGHPARTLQPPLRCRRRGAQGQLPGPDRLHRRMTHRIGMTAMTRATNSRTFGFDGRTVMVALLAALPLAACQQGPMTTGTVPLTVEERHPIGVVPERVVLDVGAPGGAMSPRDAEELQSFVMAYGQEGQGPLYVLAPNGSANRRDAELIYAEARRIAHDSGIPVAAISYAGYDAPPGPAPVRLLYERLTAATTCGQWPTNAASDLRNEPYYNYGCATQKNLAAMIEDPRDLESMRPTTPRDATRRQVVHGKYQQGQSTATDYGDDGAGRISDVGN